MTEEIKKLTQQLNDFILKFKNHNHDNLNTFRIKISSIEVPKQNNYTPLAGGKITLNLVPTRQHYIQMPAGNITILVSGDTNNEIFLISITQDSGGSRTVTWFPTIKWTGGTTPTLTTTANKRDTFGFIRTGVSTYDGFIIGQNI